MSRRRGLAFFWSLLVWSSCAALKPTASDRLESPVTAATGAATAAATATVTAAAGGPTAATPLNVLDGGVAPPLDTAKARERSCQATIAEIKSAADESGLNVTIRAGRGGVRVVVIHRGGVDPSDRGVLGVVFFQRSSNLPFAERCVRDGASFDIIKI